VGLVVALVADDGIISVEVHFGNVGETSTDGFHSLTVVLTDEGNGIDILLADILGRYLFVLPTIGDGSLDAPFISVWVVSILALSAGDQVVHTGDVSVLLALVNGLDAELLLSLVLIQLELGLAFQTLVLSETEGLALTDWGSLETLVVAQVESGGTQLTSGDIFFVPGTIINNCEGVALEFVGGDGEVVGALETDFVDCIVGLAILDAPVDYLSEVSVLALGTPFF